LPSLELWLEIGKRSNNHHQEVLALAVLPVLTQASDAIDDAEAKGESRPICRNLLAIIW
jgi:hypothetical protein